MQSEHIVVNSDRVLDLEEVSQLGEKIQHVGALTVSLAENRSLVTV